MINISIRIVKPNKYVKSLYFLAALPLPVVTLPSAPGLHTDIGEPLSLNCVASIVNHLVVHPIMEWLLPNGTRISRNLTVLGTSNVSETVYTSMLSFDSIQASDRGLYRCNVSISIPEVPVAVFSMNVTTLSIRRKYMYS